MSEQMRVYVASSWRNERQPVVVEALRDAGYDVYDFRNPEEGDAGFHWSQIGPNWQHFRATEYQRALGHKLAEDGFAKDMAALRSCDVVVLVLPCGASAHLEAGWAAAAGKHLLILLDDDFKPELMYKMGVVCATIGECLLEIREIE